MADQHVDYYSILEVPTTATPEQIRTAYKKSALKWHPDRVPSDSPERPTRTKKFQQINDAYYTLSDPTRRRDYDAARQWDNDSFASDPADEDIPRQTPPKKKGGWNWFNTATPDSSSTTDDSTNFSERQWSSAFEEMMSDAAEDEAKSTPAGKTPTGRFWTVVGSISGGALGFIVGNTVGMITGAGAGAKLGAIRDAHGKSVYEVFQTLPQADKAKILGELATKLFAQAVSG